jgi:hypothetical protein
MLSIKITEYASFQSPGHLWHKTQALRTEISVPYSCRMAKRENKSPIHGVKGKLGEIGLTEERWIL